MFDFSFSELLLVAVIALLVLGPRQLIALATRLGSWLRKSRLLLAKIKNEFEGVDKQQTLLENEKRAKVADEKYNN